MGICKISSNSNNYRNSTCNIRCCQPFPAIIMRKQNDSAKFMRWLCDIKTKANDCHLPLAACPLAVVAVVATAATFLPACCPAICCTYSHSALLAAKRSGRITRGINSIHSITFSRIPTCNTDVHCWPLPATTTVLTPAQPAATRAMGKT